MSLKSTKWLQEGKAIRKREWPMGAFIILVRKNEDTFILSHWPSDKDDIVFIPAEQLPGIIQAEQHWPDTYECMPEQTQLKAFLLKRLPGIIFFNELTAITHAYNYFQQNREEISRTAKKRFVVICDDEVIGEFDDPIDGAIVTLKKGYALGEFIIQDLSVDTLMFQTQSQFHPHEN